MSAPGGTPAQSLRHAARLSRLSRRSYQNPYTALDWPAARRPRAGLVQLARSYVSLYGTPAVGAWTSRRAAGSPSTRQPASTASTSTARRA